MLTAADCVDNYVCGRYNQCSLPVLDGQYCQNSGTYLGYDKTLQLCVRTLLIFTCIHITDLLLAFYRKIGWSAGQCSALSHCDSPSAKCMGPLEFCHVDGKHIQAMQYWNYCHLHDATSVFPVSATYV